MTPSVSPCLTATVLATWILDREMMLRKAKHTVFGRGGRFAAGQDEGHTTEPLRPGQD